ncbi:MAG: DUF721 domain-containing protein [Candidatus Neomarinimicrobiota bacterium]
MEELSKVLTSLLRKTGIESAVLQNKAVILWNDVVGEPISKNTIPEEVKQGTLIVRVSTPVWRNELIFKKQEIIEKLNRALGRKIIKDIKLI